MCTFESERVVHSTLFFSYFGVVISITVVSTVLYRSLLQEDRLDQYMGLVYLIQ